MPGMYLMGGFANDEFYSTPLQAVYDGQDDFSFGLFGMLPENAAADEAIFSCYRPNTDNTGWELRTQGAWNVKTTQRLSVLNGANAGAATDTHSSAALALPHGMAMRPFSVIATFDVNGNATVYFNGVLEVQAAITVLMTPATAGDTICLGHGFAVTTGNPARPGTNWLVNAMFLESSILDAAHAADIYRNWIMQDPSAPIHSAALGLDHVWYAADAKRSNLLADVAPVWYSRPGAVGGTPLAMTADVNDGLYVDYYPNIAFSL